MAKASSSVARGTPISAPLLRSHGAGPRYDVPGARKPTPGFAVETVKARQIESKKPGKPGIGGQVDLMA